MTARNVPKVSAHETQPDGISVNAYFRFLNILFYVIMSMHMEQNEREVMSHLLDSSEKADTVDSEAHEPQRM